MIKNYLKFLITEKLSSNFINEISKEEKELIIEENCTEYKNNNVSFYRGDNSLTKPYYIIDPSYIIRREGNIVNHISNIFTSSKLWDNYPIRKKSVDITSDFQMASFHSKNVYKVIPLDGAKLVCLPEMFNNYTNPTVSEEFKNMSFGRKVNKPGVEPYYLNQALTSAFGYIDDYEDAIKLVEHINENIEKTNTDKIDNKDYKLIIDTIIENMKKHNMSFIEYMEYIYSPKSYDVIKYKNMTKLDREKYESFYTDSKLLLTQY